MSTEAFFQFADPLPECMLLTRSDGTILAANRSLSNQVGLSPRELGTKRLAEIVADAPAVIASFLRACAESHETVVGSLVLLRQDGRPRVCRCQGTCVCHQTENASLVLMRLLPK